MDNVVNQPSAVSRTIAQAGAKTNAAALPHEILHNLQYQHNWTDLRLHEIGPETANDQDDPITAASKSAVLISGLPPRHSYIHPDFLSHLIQHKIEEVDVPVQREWVLPLSIGEKWSMQRFCGIFDALPQRALVAGAGDYRHQDTKRVLAAMLAHNGTGGDGTIVYYIMQEGDIKPRQN